MRLGDASKAAVAVGYGIRNASKQAQTILARPDVMAEVDRLRKEIMAEGKFGLAKAMKEAEDGIEFAKQTENANAYATLVIHRAKLHGLVIDKADHRISGNFQLSIEGIDQVRNVGDAIEASAVVPLVTGVTGGGKQE